MPEVHNMILETPLVNGVGVWSCPSCGRKLLIRNGPNFAKQVLVEGDRQNIHLSTIEGPSAEEARRNDEEWLSSVGIAWE